MAIFAGAIASHDENALSNREDLSDLISDISPTETPVYTAAGKNRATATSHDWLTDVLEAAESNVNLEGEEQTAVKPAARVRLSNHCQLLHKHAVTTATQEKVATAGAPNEMAYQVGRRMKAIKRDVEFAIVGDSNAKVADDGTDGAEMGSLDTYLAGTSYQSDAGAAPTGNGVDAPAPGDGLHAGRG